MINNVILNYKQVSNYDIIFFFIFTARYSYIYLSLLLKNIIFYVQMIIRPSGEVSLCCNDAYGQITLGNVTQQTLEEVWFGEDYKRIRAAIRRGRKNVCYVRVAIRFFIRKSMNKESIRVGDTQ